jgi:hypothetical protein
MEDNIELYRHLFDETLFLVPEAGAVAQQPRPAAPVAAEPEAPALGDTAQPPAYQLLGENRKGLVIAVALPEPQFRALPANEFLTKVLGAIQRSPADVAFVNVGGGEKLRVFDLAKQTQLNHLVAFGPGLIDTESNIGLYKPAAIGQVPLLIGDPVAEIEKDVNKKKLLWAGLQAIFLK